MANGYQRLHSYLNPKYFIQDVAIRLRNLNYRLQEMWRTPRVQCALCGWQGVAFRSLSFAAWSKADQLCPQCQAYPRHRLLAEHIVQESAYRRYQEVLDIGAGASFKRLFRAPGQRYQKADLHMQSGVDLQLDVQNMQLPSDSVDCLICLHVLDHVVDDHQAMREMARILKPGGRLVLQSRINWQLPQSHDYYPAFSPQHPLQYRDYGADFMSRFSHTGLQFTPVQFTASMPGASENDRWFIMANKIGKHGKKS